MTYKEAWEAIHFRHCEETCDYAYMDNCQEGKCEYYMALQALNRQYYAECGSVWTKPLADRKTENSSEKPNNCDTCRNKGFEGCEQPCLGCGCCGLYEPKDEPTTQTETQNSNLTFEKRTMLDCYNCKRFETDDECIECHYEPKDEPQTDCAWKKGE